MATGSPKRAGRGIDQAHRQAEAGLTKQRKSPVVGGRAFPDGKRGGLGGFGFAVHGQSTSSWHSQILINVNLRSPTAW